jgi:predicted DNA-binding ribbon-helix-helix protein
MWDALAEIAQERGRSVHDVVTAISLNYDAPNLSAAIRVYIVEFYRDKLHATEQPPQSGTILKLRE